LADNAVDTAEIADNAVTLAKMDGLARGTLIYGDASGDPAALAVGGADEVLTHDGTDLSWAAAAGGENTPAFKAEMSAGQTITNTSYTVLEFDTEVYDTDSRFDTGTYRFTPVTLGKYYVTAGVAFDSATDADKFGVMIRLNGASKVGSTVIQRSYNTAITAGTITVTDVADYLDVHCYQDSGGSLNINNYAPFVHFEAYRLIGV
jgi:hypothetical protein